MRPALFGVALTLATLTLAPPAAAQSNLIPGTDVELGILGSISALGRQGAYPGGMNGVSMSTTSCNLGSVNVPWLEAMEEDHPVIAFLAMRESNGRMVQISNRSNVKHGFFALSNSQCYPCQNPSNGTFLGVGCSDTYGTSTNGSNYHLGPADEIDPWLGTWFSKCSYFDMGDPPVAPQFQCDNNRSFNSSQANALGPVGNRMHLPDAELDVPGTFWYQAQYVVRGEPLGNRLNNLGSRRFTPNWNGSSWNLGSSVSLLDGSVLQRWSGATVNFASNGLDDGTVWVAATATETSPGMWHYEYAVHNVDNNRAFDALQIPIAAGATASGFGFSDVDSNGANDWSAAQVGTQVVFSTSDNPVRWNTIYNFWFDANVGPVAGDVSVDQFLAGAGQDSIGVGVLVPLEGDAPFVYCTPKTSSSGCVTAIAAGSPQPISGANDYSVFATTVEGQKNGLLFGGISGPAALPFSGGTLCVNPPQKRGPVINSAGNLLSCNGSFATLVNDGNVIPQGLDAGPGNTGWYQWWYRDPANGAGVLGTALSNGIEIDFQ